MIDVFGEDRGGTCALLLLQSWLEGRRLSIHTLIMSQLPDISETITVGGYFVSKTFTGKLSLQRVLAHQAVDYIGGFMRGAQRAPLLIRLGAFNVQSCFFSSFPTVAVQEWPKPKAAIQIRFHLNQLGERPRERKQREGLCQSPSSQIQKSLPRKKEECRGWERRRGIQRNFRGYFFSSLSLPPLDIKILEKVGGEAAETVVKDGRAASVDALPRGRHGRTPRPGAAYAGWHGGYGRRGKKAGHRRHITANNDHHRPKLRRSTGQVRIR